MDAFGRRPRQDQTLIFEDTLDENNGFMSAPWAVFWSVFGAKCGPRWAANVTKNLGPKSTEKYSQNDAMLGAQRGPKWGPKIDHFFGVFLKTSVNIGGGYENRTFASGSPRVRPLNKKIL